MQKVFPTINPQLKPITQTHIETEPAFFFESKGTKKKAIKKESAARLRRRAFKKARAKLLFQFKKVTLFRFEQPRCELGA